MRSLSYNNLRAAGAAALAPALAANGSLTSLNLAQNQLCGLDKDTYGHGTYTAKGITAIADALRVNGGLTSVELRGNMLGDMLGDWGAIFAAICGNKDSKIVSMDASSENISPAGVKPILLCNCKALQGKAGFKLHFCDACACCLGFVIITMCLLLVQGLKL